MKSLQRSAFTLVELIVVIVILGVLATIGFVSYSGYLGGARDGNRITQLKNINDSLNLYGATKTLPLPDDYITVTAGTTTVGYQGYAGENVLELINYISGGQDPKDDTYYTYYLTQDRKNIQLMALLEESEGLQTHNTITNPLTNPLIPQTYAADYSNRYPKVYGKKLGVLVSNATATKNTPAQEMTTTDIDLATSTIYTAYLDDTNNINSSTNTGALLTTIPNGSCNRIKQTGGSKGSGTYKINPDGTGDIEVYCDMETNGGGWALIGSKVTSGTQVKGALNTQVIKPGTDTNAILPVNFALLVSQAMACSSENCWVWSFGSNFRSCLTSGCFGVAPSDDPILIKHVSGTNGQSSINGNLLYYSITSGTGYFEIVQAGNTAGLGGGGLSGTNRRPSNGTYPSTAWQTGDKWELYVK